MTACARRGASAWLSLVVAGRLLLRAALSARAAGEYRTVEVESLAHHDRRRVGGREPAPGYLPVRFDITNLGEARVIEIVGAGHAVLHAVARLGSTSARIDASGRPFASRAAIACGSRCPVPVFGDSENMRFEIREDGRTLAALQLRRRSRAASARRRRRRSSSPIRSSAVRQRWRQAGRRTRLSIVPRRCRPCRRAAGDLGGRRPPLDFVLEPARLPTNWLGYTSLRAVVIGPAEWEQLNDAQKSALLDVDRVRRRSDLSSTATSSTLFPDAAASARHGDRRGRAAYFFGRIHLPTSAAIAAAGLDDALAGRRAAAAGRELGAAGEPRARLGHRSPRADSGCRFQASAACRPAPTCRS